MAQKGSPRPRGAGQSGAPGLCSDRYPHGPSPSSYVPGAVRRGRGPRPSPAAVLPAPARLPARGEGQGAPGLWQRVSRDRAPPRSPHSRGTRNSRPSGLRSPGAPPQTPEVPWRRARPAGVTGRQPIAARPTAEGRVRLWGRGPSLCAPSGSQCACAIKDASGRHVLSLHVAASPLHPEGRAWRGGGSGWRPPTLGEHEACVSAAAGAPAARPQPRGPSAESAGRSGGDGGAAPSPEDRTPGAVLDPEGRSCRRPGPLAPGVPRDEGANHGSVSGGFFGLRTCVLLGGEGLGDAVRVPSATAADPPPPAPSRTQEPVRLALRVRRGRGSCRDVPAAGPERRVRRGRAAGGCGTEAQPQPEDRTRERCWTQKAAPAGSPGRWRQGSQGTRVQSGERVWGRLVLYVLAGLHLTQLWDMQRVLQVAAGDKDLELEGGGQQRHSGLAKPPWEPAPRASIPRPPPVLGRPPFGFAPPSPGTISPKHLVPGLEGNAGLQLGFPGLLCRIRKGRLECHHGHVRPGEGTTHPVSPQGHERINNRTLSLSVAIELTLVRLLRASSPSPTWETCPDPVSVPTAVAPNLLWGGQSVSVPAKVSLGLGGHGRARAPDPIPGLERGLAGGGLALLFSLGCAGRVLATPACAFPFWVPQVPGLSLAELPARGEPHNLHSQRLRTKSQTAAARADLAVSSGVVGPAPPPPGGLGPPLRGPGGQPWGGEGGSQWKEGGRAPGVTELRALDPYSAALAPRRGPRKGGAGGQTGRPPGPPEELQGLHVPGTPPQP
ncbi:collagen alpha-1(I) chain-like [Choloepus didactylus]|uniref:collagen alpha-1(I) chain-like n=1 Tax=Choloepus didactylus TaxID=27675 RepID=UPI00189F4166|nr:collagen alpha-1(I) chain-like [Choloepus didactylus]